ncbi:MAG: DUF1028 domain-containing protein [Asgard group archaeon]|nr:DUF1028 domain-containing protein [Asgard group archaeon]
MQFWFLNLAIVVSFVPMEQRNVHHYKENNSKKIYNGITFNSEINFILMTFSIVAFDKEAGEVGFAIASCCWNAGGVCAAVAGKGAIAHQAQGNTDYHPIFFEQLDKKKSLDEILNHFREIDEHIERRQIGFVNINDENSLSFTGENCSYWAGHKTGVNYACQGNILIGPEVLDAMVEAFENTKGNLTTKLYNALLAGDKSGGDARGKQSARLHIKGMRNGEKVTIVEFNITDHEAPVQEIGRLLNVDQNYRKFFDLQKKFIEAKTNEERITILRKSQEFLEDKKESRYIDLWATIGYNYFTLEKFDDVIYCYKTILKISPTMAKSIEFAAKKFNIPDSIIESIFEK